MFRKLLPALMLLPLAAFSQDESPENRVGMLQLGYRSTCSAFSDIGYYGLGSGGQFRILLAPRLNTEWYYDYISTNIGGLGRRSDQHIGWSVMYYAFVPYSEKRCFVPYVEAGNCFDYTAVRSNYTNGAFASRGSAAVHAGIGTHFMLGTRTDLTLKAQYMMHIGTSVEEKVITDPLSGSRSLIISKGDAGIDGHLLITCSVNFNLCHLWRKNKKATSGK
jgi:hypothetical protein